MRPVPASGVRAPPSRRQVAAARKRRRRLRRAAEALAGGALAVSEIRREDALCNVLDFRRRKRRTDRRVCRDSSRCVACAVRDAGRGRRHRRTTLASRPRCSAQSRRVFSTPFFRKSDRLRKRPCAARRRLPARLQCPALSSAFSAWRSRCCPRLGRQHAPIRSGSSRRSWCLMTISMCSQRSSTSPSTRRWKRRLRTAYHCTSSLNSSLAAALVLGSTRRSRN